MFKSHPSIYGLLSSVFETFLVPIGYGLNAALTYFFLVRWTAIHKRRLPFKHNRHLSPTLHCARYTVKLLKIENKKMTVLGGCLESKSGKCPRKHVPSPQLASLLPKFLNHKLKWGSGRQQAWSWYVTGESRLWLRIRVSIWPVIP